MNKISFYKDRDENRIVEKASNHFVEINSGLFICKKDRSGLMNKEYLYSSDDVKQAFNFKSRTTIKFKDGTLIANFPYLEF